MNPLSMETIFIILSGAILVAGVLYWLWSHIQLTQKKVQLLENAVFELRSMLAVRATEPPVPMIGGSFPIVGDVIGSSAKPPSEYKDLEDDDWKETSGEEDVKNVPLEVEEHTPTLVVNESVSDDLMPGGRISIPEGADADAGAEPLRELTLEEATAPLEGERFREFFKQSETVRTTDSLESMPVRELRRLAEQRGITGAADMRKKEILAALRQQITSTPAPAPAVSAEVSVEKEGAAAEILGTTDAEILE